MPFESKFSKDEIIDAAFDIAKKSGFGAISARSVAKKIGSSVAPIYFNFKNINDVTEAVVQRVFLITQDILNEQKSDNLYENMGRAGFVFAERYPVIFRELVLQPNPYLTTYETTEIAMLQALDADPHMKNWSMDERRRLILKMKALQTGVAAMVANDQLPSWITKEEFQDLLIELGHDLQAIQKLKKDKV